MYVSQNQTENFGLHLWEPGDNFLREEFNENFEAIDRVVAAKCAAAAGTYTGDGAASQFIELGFRPVAVLVESQNGTRPQSGNYVLHDGLALPGFPMCGGSTASPTIEVVSGGFRVYAYSGYTGNNNAEGKVYYYIAFR